MEEVDQVSQFREQLAPVFAWITKATEHYSKITKDLEKIRNDYSHQHEFLKWDRETHARLYYPLWILFVGGFVFSLSTDKYHSPIPSYLLILLYLFRILAIIGTGLNFWVQRLALRVLRYEWETEVYLGWFQKRSAQFRNVEMPDGLDDAVRAVEDFKKDEEEAMRLFHRAENRRTLSEQKDATLQKLEKLLLCTSAVFLILMLVLTWQIVP